MASIVEATSKSIDLHARGEDSTGASWYANKPNALNQMTEPSSAPRLNAKPALPY